MLGSDAVPIITSWDKGKKFLKLENKRVVGGGGASWRQSWALTGA